MTSSPTQYIPTDLDSKGAYVQPSVYTRIDHINDTMASKGGIVDTVFHCLADGLIPIAVELVSTP